MHSNQIWHSIWKKKNEIRIKKNRTWHSSRLTKKQVQLKTDEGDYLTSSCGEGRPRRRSNIKYFFFIFLSNRCGQKKIESTWRGCWIICGVLPRLTYTNIDGWRSVARSYPQVPLAMQRTLALTPAHNEPNQLEVIRKNNLALLSCKIEEQIIIYWSSLQHRPI